MKLSKERLNDFLADKPFFENKECYCLGNSLEEAAEIVSKITNFDRKDIMRQEREEQNVGLDTG